MIKILEIDKTFDYLDDDTYELVKSYKVITIEFDTLLDVVNCNYFIIEFCNYKIYQEDYENKTIKLKLV